MVYILSSAGIDAKHPYEILEMYKNFDSQIIKNSFIISTELGLYGGAVIIWGKIYNLENIAFLIDLFIVGVVFCLFGVGYFGIKRGTDLSKTTLLSKLNKNFISYNYMESDIDKADSLQKLIKILALMNITNLIKDATGIDNEFYNINSIIYAAFSSVLGITIKNAIEYIFYTLIYLKFVL